MSQQETELIDFFAGSERAKPESYRSEKRRKVSIISNGVEGLKAELNREMIEYQKLLTSYISEYGLAVKEKEKRYN